MIALRNTVIGSALMICGVCRHVMLVVDSARTGVMVTCGIVGRGCESRGGTGTTTQDLSEGDALDLQSRE